LRSRDLQDLFPARRTAAHDTPPCTLAGYSSMGREGATRSRSPGHERARACMQDSSTGQDRPDVGIEPTTRCLFHRRGKGHSTATRSSGSEISSFTRRRRYAPIRRPPSVSLLPVAVDSCLALAASFVLASRCRQTAADQPPTLIRQTGSLPTRTARTLTGTSSPPRQEGRRGHHPFRGGQQGR